MVCTFIRHKHSMHKPSVAGWPMGNTSVENVHQKLPVKLFPTEHI